MLSESQKICKMRLKKETEAVGALYKLVGIEERQDLNKHIPYPLVSVQVPSNW